LLKILKGEGETAALGEPIAIVGSKGEDISALLKEVSSNGAKTAAPKADDQPAPPAKVEKPAELELKQTSIPAAASAAATTTARPATNGQSARMLVSPIAARMAADNSIDLKTIAGSGPNGRIIKRDIETALAGPSRTASSTQPQSYVSSMVVGASAYRDEPTSQMRRVIASRLTESIGPVPTFYLTVEIEMDNALELRKAVNAGAGDEEKISVNDIIVKASAMALMKHPFVNSSYQDKNIRFYGQADIGVAVAIDEGLITPVIRGANLKGFREISAEIKDLAGKARAKKLQPDQYTGATFSISNLGMFGIKEFTAIINPPEAGILAVGGAQPTPVVRNGEIVVCSVMHVTMSCDHRVVDGATGAKFLQTFKSMLEQPAMMLA
jgi:pyruvate dehydrogenase E2 component (dihydrolipoamide acetyltransferase)